MVIEIMLGISTFVLFFVLVIEIVVLHSRLRGVDEDEVKEVKAVVVE
tara:strand:+ start:18484 stop:18624 length:141 start_codon:yes stop_codon:yes gene_type:complete